jgi:DNA polymerase-1
LFGRRLYLPDINSRNTSQRQYAERTAINAPMQGTAADIIKRAMIELAHWIERRGAPLTMILQVHDELIFEAPVEEADAMAKEIGRIMRSCASLDVPLEVDIGIGNNWDEAH